MNMRHAVTHKTHSLISPLKVMHSEAGWYIGRTYLCPASNLELPYSRESAGYWDCPENAADALSLNLYQIKY